MKIDNLEIATNCFRSEYGKLRSILDISSADRFGENIICVMVPTVQEWEDLHNILPGYYMDIRVYISPMFGLGSFTRRTVSFWLFDTFASRTPFNIHGTIASRLMALIMNRIEANERAAWAAMSETARSFIIEAEVARNRKIWRPDYAKCWYQTKT